MDTALGLVVNEVVTLKTVSNWTASGLKLLAQQARTVEQVRHLGDVATDSKHQIVNAEVTGLTVSTDRVRRGASEVDGCCRPQAPVWYVRTNPMLSQTLADKQIQASLAQLFAKVNAIASSVVAPSRPRKGGKLKMRLTVDQRVKELHLKSPAVAEEEPLRVLAKILKCVKSAIPGGEYYETELKPKREKARAEKADERRRAENRQVNRDMRDHIASVEDIDDRIDATWDTRKGGRSGGK